MKHLMKVSIGFVALMAVSAPSIAQACVPVPPRDLEGNIAFLPVVRVSITASYFEQNGCDWAGSEQLNGLDAVVLDAEGLSGPASITAIINSGFATPMQVDFLDAGCAPLGDTNYFGSSAPVAPQAFVLTVPENTKWAVVQASAELPVGDASRDIDIQIHSDGKDCPDVKPKKKKNRR